MRISAISTGPKVMFAKVMLLLMAFKLQVRFRLPPLVAFKLPLVVAFRLPVVVVLTLGLQVESSFSPKPAHSKICSLSLKKN